MKTNANGREADYPIDPLFLERWSPRAFTGEPIAPDELFTLFEAARWAPSSYNSQPWRFLYARRDTPAWDRFLDLLVPQNQDWARNAAALVFLISNSTMTPPGSDKPTPSYSHSLDAGAASANFALQATRMGWHAHGMVGFDRERAFTTLGVPPGYRVEAAYAVGRQGDKSTLPPALQERESPNGRNPVSWFAFEGGFPAA